MSLADVVLANFGEGTIHSKDEIISAIKQQNRVYRIPVLGGFLASVRFRSGLTLEGHDHQTNEYSAIRALRKKNVLYFDRQTDGDDYTLNIRPTIVSNT